MNTTKASEGMIEAMKDQLTSELELEIEKHLIGHFESVILPEIRNKMMGRLVITANQMFSNDSIEISIQLKPMR